MSIQDQYDAIARCNRCGFCQVACPVYRTTGHEAGVARGRLALLRGIIEKRVAWSRDLEGPLFNCLRCGACTSNCFPAVATADLVAEARAEYLDILGRSPLHRLLFRHILPNPRRLRRVARAVAFGKNRGVSRAARALGMLRVFGHDLARAEQIVERFPERAFRDAVSPGLVAGQAPAGRVAYFVGCGVDIMCPETAAATLGLLRRRCQSVQVLDNCCCGLPPETYGDRAAATELVIRNLEVAGGDDVDTIVTDCSSCAAFLRRYPALLGAEHPLQTRAQAFASRVRDLLAFLRPEPTRPPSTAASRPLVVTWHDPCHAVRGQKLGKEPREILRCLPGIEYRELPEADWCCGGAGAYALSHYDLSQRIGDRKMANLAKTGAELLVTSCPAYIVQLRYGIRRHGLSVRVCHLSELVAGTWQRD